MLGESDLRELLGRDVVDRAGKTIGNLETYFVDRDTGEAEWLGVFSGMFRSHHYLVPVRDAEREGAAVRVPWTRTKSTKAPEYQQPDKPISRRSEREAYSHFGVDGRRLSQPDLAALRAASSSAGRRRGSRRRSRAPCPSPRATSTVSPFAGEARVQDSHADHRRRGRALAGARERAAGSPSFVTAAPYSGTSEPSIDERREAVAAGPSRSPRARLAVEVRRVEADHLVELHVERDRSRCWK